MKSVDILISSYNGEEYIVEQLDSLLCQSYEKINIIIRDDGSVDRTKDIILEYAEHFPGKINFFPDEENLGSSKSFLKLLELSRAEYFMFCDQDDVWYADKVEMTLRKMEEIEASAPKDLPILVFSDLKVVDSSLNLISESLWKTQKLDPTIALNWKHLLAQNVVTGCTMMLNKNIKKHMKSGLNFKIHHDQLLAVLAAKNGKVAWLDKPTMLYRQHQKNVLGALGVDQIYLIKKFLNFKENIKFFVEAIKYFDNDVSILELIFNKISINIKRI